MTCAWASGETRARSSSLTCCPASRSAPPGRAASASLDSLLANSAPSRFFRDAIRLFRPGPLLTLRCPVFRRRDSHLGLVWNLRPGHAKGKGSSGGPARLKVPMGQSSADHSRRLLGQRETGGTRLSRRKAPAFAEWHEPDEARVSRPNLSEARGEIPRTYSAHGLTTRRGATRRSPRRHAGGNIASRASLSSAIYWADYIVLVPSA